jgi:hypothetical protein
MKYLVLVLTLMTACVNKGGDSPSPTPGPIPTSQPGANGSDGKSVFVLEEDANVDECEAGGVKHTFYVDEDRTSSFTDADTILSTSIICNGVQGETGADSDVVGPSGTNGTNGANGTNGHSIVSNSRTATGGECGTGGTALDVYTDLDDSLTYTVGDTLQNTLVACTGAAGPTGAQGSSATANITTINSLTTTCVAAGTHFVRLRQAASCDVDVYTTNTNCSGQLSRVKRLTASADEFYWTGANQLLTVECSTTNVVTVKVINFL